MVDITISGDVLFCPELKRGHNLVFVFKRNSSNYFLASAIIYPMIVYSSVNRSTVKLDYCSSFVSTVVDCVLNSMPTVDQHKVCFLVGFFHANL